MSDITRDYNKGDKDAAIQAAVQEIDAHPHDPKRYATLATMLIGVADYDQATQLLVQALGLFPNDPELLYAFGLVAYAQANPRLAVNYFAQVGTGHKQLSTDAQYMLALSYRGLNQPQKALAFALTAHEADPTKADAALLTAQLLLATGAFQAAATLLAPLLPQKNAQVLFTYGTAVTSAGGDGSQWLDAAKAADPANYAQQAGQLRDIAGFLKASEPDD